MPPNQSWGDSRLYAVLQRTLDKDCRQAEELKQLVDEASRFHLGHQCQQSAVICSGTWLFSSRVLRPSLVTLCSHKSGRCAVELYHVPHLWYPPFYTYPMASSALPRQQWSLLNHFRMEQGHCSACRRKWRLTDTDLCPCSETQTMFHIVEFCPLTKLNGGLSRLHSADED